MLLLLAFGDKIHQTVGPHGRMGLQTTKHKDGLEANSNRGIFAGRNVFAFRLSAVDYRPWTVEREP